jgi:hypothetical protein
LPALIAGVTERPWSFSGIDWLSWSLLAAVLAVPSWVVRKQNQTRPEASLSMSAPLPQLVDAA